MALAIAYELVGTGWAKCTISSGKSTCVIRASYLSDALGKLVLAALGVAAGFSSVSFGFEIEPGEFRWFIRSLESDRIELELQAFDVAWDIHPEAVGRPLFLASCRPLEFARAVHQAALAVLNEYGEGGYRSRWAEHPFPSRQLFLLTEVLALPENAG